MIMHFSLSPSTGVWVIVHLFVWIVGAIFEIGHLTFYRVLLSGSIFNGNEKKSAGIVL